MRLYKVDTLTDALAGELVAVWEASVRATHHFLTGADILALRPQVAEALAQVELHCLEEDGCVRAFLGTHGEKIEMLFIHPGCRGKGLGKRLIRHALDELGMRCVDVNEQNTQGVGFYEHMGFHTVSRSERDGQGNPFPLLHMEVAG